MIILAVARHQYSLLIILVAAKPATIGSVTWPTAQPVLPLSFILAGTIPVGSFNDCALVVGTFYDCALVDWLGW